MASNPTHAELVQAVRDFIANTARPVLTGHAAFHARVAENALAIVERELMNGDRADAAAIRRLQALLDRTESDRDVLERLLCTQIRSGKLSWKSPELMAHLKSSTIDQVRIDQPKYSGLAIATESD